MNHFSTLCQSTVRVFLIFLISSCALNEKKQMPRPKKEFKASWFKVPRRFSAKTRTGEFRAHPFFDLSPGRKEKGLSLNYFVLTNKGSSFSYDFDLLSGKTFKKFAYCAQSDVWESYASEIFRPNFTEGVIPRLLDPTGVAQRIWVFGAKGNEEAELIASKAKVIGGVVVQYCHDYPCKSGVPWVGKVILIGVNEENPSFAQISNLEELKDKVDWGYTKAFAQNGYGRNKSSSVEEPSHRLVGEVGAKKAIDFVFSKGHLFRSKEMKSLRKNCFKLYDYLWDSSLKVRANLKEASFDKKDIIITERAKEIRQFKKEELRNVRNYESRSNLKQEAYEKGLRKERFKNFRLFFDHFENSYKERFKTCKKFVRPSDIQDNKDRHWFFNYLINYVNLEDLGFVYSCKSNTWLRNPTLSSGKKRFKNERKTLCARQKFEKSFDSSINLMIGLNRSGKEHYRFVEYDSGIGGTKEPLYSWVFSNGKTLSCQQKQLKRSKASVFPTDISWQEFESN